MMANTMNGSVPNIDVNLIPSLIIPINHGGLCEIVCRRYFALGTQNVRLFHGECAENHSNVALMVRPRICWAHLVWERRKTPQY